MKQRELKPPKPLKVSSIEGLDIGPEQQRTDETLKRYWRLVDKPSVEGKPQFVVKKRFLNRKLKTKTGMGYKMQLVVPAGLREKVVALAHDTLLSGQLKLLEEFNKSSIGQEFITS